MKILRGWTVFLSLILVSAIKYPWLRHHRRDPTPVEIAAACLRIQATWDEQTERARRMGVAPDCSDELELWTPQQIDLHQLDEASEYDFHDAL